MMQGEFFTVNSEQTRDFAKKHIDELFNRFKWFQFTVNTEKGRSTLQNSALHVYCAHLARALNESGQLYTFKFNGKEQQCEWTGETVKDRIWRPIQIALTNKKSSAHLSTKECTQVYENVNALTAERLEISVDWPTRGSA